MQTFWCF